MRRTSFSRRQTLTALLGAGVWACRPATQPEDPAHLPPQLPIEPAPERPAFFDNVDALFDVLVPVERDAQGRLVSPGAREARADRVLQTERFVRLAMRQGLLPVLPEPVVDALADLSGQVRATVNRQLDALATQERPLTAWRELSRGAQEKLLAQALEDPAMRPALTVLRAACFVGYLGAVASDVGLRAVGFPAFERFEEGIAVSGYPRTRDGRLVDPAKESLAALAAAGQLDDYTYNRAPAPTPGDDLSLVLDANGDLR